MSDISFVKQSPPSNPGTGECAVYINTSGVLCSINESGVVTTYSPGLSAGDVLGVVLVGLSLATNAAITASDSILSAFGKLQAQINSHFGQGGSVHALATTIAAGFMSAADKIKLDGLVSDLVIKSTNQYISSNNTILTAITDLTINVVSGKTYVFEMYIKSQTSAAGNGIAIGVSGSASGNVSAIVNSPVSNGTNGMFTTIITATNSATQTTGFLAANTTFVNKVYGIFEATSSGTFYPVFRPENNGQTLTIREGSIVSYKEL